MPFNRWKVSYQLINHSQQARGILNNRRFFPSLFLGCLRQLRKIFLKSFLDEDFRCYVALRYSFATFTPKRARKCLSPTNRCC
jgi:hypothetical protein